MEVKCEYCGSMIPDNMPSCPNCGAPNTNMHREANGIPQTIEELKTWYQARNLPPYEVTRFFIGEDYRGPKAYGIYKNGEKVIVYKNKSDGTRTIRYEGTDEDYAVNELYLKLKAEIINQKEHQTQRTAKSNFDYQVPNYNSGGNHKRPFNKKLLTILIIIGIIAILSFGNCGRGGGNEGSFFPFFFYGDGNNYYNSYDSDYDYDYDSNYGGGYYHNDNSYEGYDSYDSWDSGWDSDYDWDSGSDWDSGWSDWDSDW